MIRTGVVLPAPFSPNSPCTPPRATWRSRFIHHQVSLSSSIALLHALQRNGGFNVPHSPTFLTPFLTVYGDRVTVT